MHKEADVEERLNYKDEIVDTRHFQWQTPHTTAQHKNSGQKTLFTIRVGELIFIYL
ncbi:DUF3427 domain-containing protein [Bacillus sp. T3]|uniref:DUF3427 domain-containing protein n=1 Tax=Bacillus sp. T3 TaxID=467262 RepID=UPI0029811D5F|nr:DUF3427 domain-containing protein [Bacillus sp. T3]